MAEDLEAVKVVISSILIAHKGPMTISELEKEFKSFEDRPVPYQKFGCTNVRQFLNKISDTVIVTRSYTGEDVIQAKAKQEVQHIERMVKQQKPSTTKAKVRHVMHKPPVRGKYVPRGMYRGRGGGRSFGGRDYSTTVMTSQKLCEPSGSRATPSTPDSHNETTSTSTASNDAAQRRGVSRLHYSLLRSSGLLNSTATNYPIHVDTKHHVEADAPNQSTQCVKHERIPYMPLSVSHNENCREITNIAQHERCTDDSSGQASGSKSDSVKRNLNYMPCNSLVQQWTAQNCVTSSMYQPFYQQTLPIQGVSIPPGQPTLRPSLCRPFVAPLEEGAIACNGETSEQSMSSMLNPSAVAYEPRSMSIRASAGQDEHELTQRAVVREFADNQTQVAPEVTSKGTSTVDLTVDIPQGFATRIRSLLEKYPTGLDIESLMKMCEEKMGSSVYFKQNKHPLEMLPDILSSVSSVCIMPDSGGRFKVMLPNNDQKETRTGAPALPDDLRCGLLSILLKIPQGLEVSELLDLYESRFGEHRHIKTHGQCTSDFIRNILYALPGTVVKNHGDGTHTVQMLKEGLQHPMQNVGQSVPLFDAAESDSSVVTCAYPVQELPSCWTFSVAIGEVFSPSEFYILITEGDGLSRLTDLMTELDAFYSSTPADFYSVSISNLKPGFVCAALYTSNGHPLWHRAVVQSVRLREVFVSYIDYGTVMPVKVTDIRRLRSDFLELPAQAIRASLSGVKPKNEQVWPSNAKERFLELVQMGECSCSVMSKEQDTLAVELVMSLGKMEYSLSEVLINEDLAVSTMVKEEIAAGSFIETWTFSEGHTADVIMWNGGRYMSSMGISKLLGWRDDLVSTSLSKKGISLVGPLLEKKCDPELHLEVSLSDGVFYFDSVQLYHLHNIPDILRILQHPSENLRRELESKVASCTLSDQPVIVNGGNKSDNWCLSYDDESPSNTNDVNKSQERVDPCEYVHKSRTEDVEDSGSSQDVAAFRRSLQTKLAELKTKRAALRMAAYENPDSVATSDLQFIEKRVDSFSKVLKELDMNSTPQGVEEPFKLSGSNSSNHFSNVRRNSSESVVDKFQTKLMEALMTSKQK
ncbi:uncharacterized protein LOC142578765 [Dermacentor variabilis]|uniref:uncharacterized protein LOC142578765 n=1 Tax=Dermacentor variabilis TaxID=34621 RepID=UPI003F5AF925